MKNKIEPIVAEDLKNLHWMARRYADNRQSYATGMFNDITQRLLDANIKLNGCDKIIWARDMMGRRYDGLTEAEATPGTPEALGQYREKACCGPISKVLNKSKKRK